MRTTISASIHATNDPNHEHPRPAYSDPPQQDTQNTGNTPGSTVRDRTILLLLLPIAELARSYGNSGDPHLLALLIVSPLIFIVAPLVMLHHARTSPWRLLAYSLATLLPPTLIYGILTAVLTG